MSKDKKVIPYGNVDLGALQVRATEAADRLRESQDAKLKADRAFAEAKDEYARAGTAMELGLNTFELNCKVLNLIEV